MFDLFRYEFRKTRIAKLIILSAAFLLELLYLVNLYKVSENGLSLAILLLVLLAFCGAILMGIHSIVTLHRDMNTRQSHMLFMTPHSAYAILGAKILECFISILLACAVFFALGMLDITLLLNRFGKLDQLLTFLKNVIGSVGYELRTDLPFFISVFFSLFAGWIAVVVAADLSDIVSSALLNGKKFNGFVTVLIFIALTVIMEQISRLLPASFDPMTLNYVSGIADLVLAGGMYVGAAVIMDRYLSV